MKAPIEVRRQRRIARLKLRGIGYPGDLSSLAAITKWIMDTDLTTRRILAAGFAVGALIASDGLVKKADPATKPVAQPGTSEAFLWLLALLLPKRLADDHVGDAMELLAAQRARGGSRWGRLLIAARAVWWIVIATVRRIL
jgi:hypothetical protein